MQDEGLSPQKIPWSTRDVWLGVASLGLWWIAVILLSLVVAFLDLEVNAGLFIGLAELMLLGPVWWFVLRKYRVGWDSVGLRAFKGSMLGLGCGLMILSSLFNLIYSLFLALFDQQVQADLAPILAEVSSPWWLLLAGVVIAPVVEEIFFRGFVFSGLRTRYEWKKAAVISSALFALIHLQLTAIIPIFILGYIFAYLYHRSNSIWPAIVMHVSTNAIALGAAYLASNTELPM
jgi:membrane protease YdiL (CAAX protease family)